MSAAEDAATVVRDLRSHFAAGHTRPLTWRKAQLKALARMLSEQHEVFATALHADLGKCAGESELTEIGFVQGEIRHTLSHLRRRLKPQRALMPLSLQPAFGQRIYEPLGCVLIIAPWNYPLMLLLSPLVGALAAGNVALLKPSEYAPHVAEALSEWLPKYLDPQAIAIVQAGADGTAAILKQRFDHIFFTGSAAVAKHIAAAAAKHLTPTTLELGGKSPVWVGDDVKLKHAAQRIAWGKWLNAGQTCVAPDYILTTDAVADTLIVELKNAIRSMYGDDPRQSPDYGRLIHERHAQSVADLLQDVDPAQIVCGGDTDIAARYIAPTIVDHISTNDALMQQEIFGPILPIVREPNLDAAIAHINAGDKPLAAYVFSDDDTTRQRFAKETSSGALCYNLTVAHLSAKSLPFGGVGMSGHGHYMGKYSIATFSHLKPIVSKPLWPNTMTLVSAPYSAFRRWIIKHFI